MVALLIQALIHATLTAFKWTQVNHLNTELTVLVNNRLLSQFTFRDNEQNVAD